MTGIEDVEPLRACARALREAGDLYGGEQALKALLAEGEDAQAHHDLGLLYWQEGREGEALAHLERAAALDPSGPAAGALAQARRYFEGRRPPKAEGPLLVVVDYAVQPYNIGDLLIFMTGALVAAEEAGCDGIDWCFITDPKRPPQDPVMANLVSADNHLYHLLTFLPEIQLLPGLREVHLFTDHGDFNAFIQRRGPERPMWPSVEALQSRRYMFYDIFKLVHRFYERAGRIPELRFSQHLAGWADQFFRTQTGPAVPVTVNLRNNPHFHAHRNSNLPAWEALFRHCEGRYPVRFVITCAASEVDESLRGCPNVVFAKAHNTSILQDLALIQGAAFHLGSPSGPAALPIFGTQPYYIFNCDMHPHLALYEGSLLETAEGDLRYAFAKGPQAFGVGPETAEGVIAQFERIWRSRDWVGSRSQVVHREHEPAPTWMI